MAVYKTSFGDITVADGMPEFTPELLLWIEEQAAIEIPATLQRIIQAAMERSLPPSTPVHVVPTEAVVLEPVEGLTGAPGYERRNPERVAEAVDALFWSAEMRQAWNAEEAKKRKVQA